MKKFLSFIYPRKNFWRMLFIMLPAIIIGWIFFPVGTVTYIDWILIYMGIQIWDDVMEIRDKLKIG